MRQILLVALCLPFIVLFVSWNATAYGFVAESGIALDKAVVMVNVNQSAAGFGLDGVIGGAPNEFEMALSDGSGPIKDAAGTVPSVVLADVSGAREDSAEEAPVEAAQAHGTE